MMKKTLKYDLIMIISILIITVALFLFQKSDSGYQVRITIDHELYGVYDLNQDQTININDENIIIIKDHEVYMDQATCPDKTCIQQGHISKVGASIICLPHKLIIEITGEEGELDDKTY